MTAARRTRYNFGLDHAIAHAKALDRPLLVFEPLRADYRWASARLHHFVMDGMQDQAARFADSPVHYLPYVEPAVGAGKGLLAKLAQDACLVITDFYPCSFFPAMQTAAARIDARLEAVDGNGLVPLSATTKAHETAVDFRRFLQRNLTPWLSELPDADPLRDLKLPTLDTLPALHGLTDRSQLPVPSQPGPVALRGGEAAAILRQDRFMSRIADYGLYRSDPDRDAGSGLSPYLHFGHIGVHSIFVEVAAAEEWGPERIGKPRLGSKEGWWGMTPAAEGFLDELITWRELGYVFCYHRPDYDQYSSLPAWARATLDKHASDPRPHCYTLQELDAAKTHDSLWNAAQRQLRSEGHIHNYLRMLWGKKILEWSPSPQDALAVLIELNNRYALDGRDPNSYSGIFWTLGRFDRPWPPERPIFGNIRYMSSENTARKVEVMAYLQRYRS